MKSLFPIISLSFLLFISPSLSDLSNSTSVSPKKDGFFGTVRDYFFPSKEVMDSYIILLSHIGTEWNGEECGQQVGKLVSKINDFFNNLKQLSWVNMMTNGFMVNAQFKKAREICEIDTIMIQWFNEVISLSTPMVYAVRFPIVKEKLDCARESSDLKDYAKSGDCFGQALNLIFKQKV